jgi:cation diffusion facilitator CzcD-associated flavoprotein CzcO
VTTTQQATLGAATQGSGASAIEHFDVLVVGAGISGIGAAYHLADKRPEAKIAIFEARDSFGGTWDINRYPGVRSDSDMYTFGYSFAPWLADELATGEEILHYLNRVIAEHDLAKYIRFNHRIVAANWSTDHRRWVVEVVRGDSSEHLTYTTNFLWMCQGYYRQDKGYTPDFPGMNDFRGEILHPLTWPENFNYQGKKIVVIGSGATAATMVPAMVHGGAEHVTMLQRSPTYYSATPSENAVADALRSVDTPPEWVHEIIRRLTLKQGAEDNEAVRNDPEAAGRQAVELVRSALPVGYDVEKHFTPTYPLWSQRVCRVPEGDLFQAISAGDASVVTDVVGKFVPSGIEVGSGEVLNADIIVTATGFDLSVMGDIPFAVDGIPVDWSTSVTYHGTMFTGVPNLAYTFGYWRASWTLRVDLVCDLVCRLLNRMETLGVSMVTPTLRDEDESMPLLPWVDPESFNPGYLTRSIQSVPRQGDRAPWQGTDVGYQDERVIFAAIDFEDGALIFK